MTNSISDLARIIPASAAEGLSDFFRSVSTALGQPRPADAKAQSTANKLDRKTPDPSEEPDRSTRRGAGFDADPYASSFTVLQNDPYEQYFSESSRPLSRKEQYQLAHQMDAEATVVSRGLDAIMSNVCGSEDGSETTCSFGSEKDANLDRIMKSLDERARIARDMPAVVRSTIKTGDKFKEIVADDGGLIWGLPTLPPNTVTRVEQGGKLIGFYQVDPYGGVKADWGPRWIMHLRHNREDGALYGRSQMYPGRKSFVQITYLEDHTVIMVIDRAGQKRVHTIAVRKGDAGEQDRDQYIKDHVRKDTWNDNTSKYGSKYKRPAGADYVLTRVIGQKDFPETGITTLDGQSNFDKVIVVNKYYLRNLVIAMGVPLAYVGLEEDVNAKATLMHEEIEFGRMIRRIQNLFSTAYKEQVFGFQFNLLGMDVPESDYWVGFPEPAKVDKKIQAEILQLQAKAAVSLNQAFEIPLDVFLRFFVGYSEKEAMEVSQAMGLPNSESAKLNSKKQKDLFHQIREKIAKDDQFADFMRDTLVAMTHAADYFEEINEAA